MKRYSVGMACGYKQLELLLNELLFEGYVIKFITQSEGSNETIYTVVALKG
jgi:hypothetical protein